MRVIFSFFLFVLYVATLFVLPLGLLWGVVGIAIGLAFTVSFFCSIGFGGSERIASRIGMVPLTKAEAPVVQRIVSEYCRRLTLPPPKLGIIDSRAINFAVFGFSSGSVHLAITRGALTRLRREQLAALIGWELTSLWHGGVFSASWLSQFLSLTDPLMTPSQVVKNKEGFRFYSFQLVAKHLLLFPLTIFPTYLLRASADHRAVDRRAAQITGKPRELAEALRSVDAFREREPLFSPYSTRHLFLTPPPTVDPLARAFFGTEAIGARIAQVEEMNTVVVPE